MNSREPHNNFFPKNRRGQFYLVAAIAIISIVIGIATIANTSKTTKGYEIVYELGEELEIESEYVLDYGISNNLNNTQLMENFTATFSNSSKETYFYFIFGKGNNLKAYKYFNGIRSTQSYSIEDNDVKFILNNTEYRFDLTLGENFYYILAKEEGGEIYVATNSN